MFWSKKCWVLSNLTEKRFFLSSIIDSATFSSSSLFRYSVALWIFNPFSNVCLWQFPSISLNDCIIFVTFSWTEKFVAQYLQREFVQKFRENVIGLLTVISQNTYEEQKGTKHMLLYVIFFIKTTQKVF